MGSGVNGLLLIKEVGFMYLSVELGGESSLFFQPNFCQLITGVCLLLCQERDIISFMVSVFLHQLAYLANEQILVRESYENRLSVQFIYNKCKKEKVVFLSNIYRFSVQFKKGKSVIPFKQQQLQQQPLPPSPSSSPSPYSSKRIHQPYNYSSPTVH